MAEFSLAFSLADEVATATGLLSSREFWVKALLETYYGQPPSVRACGHWQMDARTWDRLSALLAPPWHHDPTLIPEAADEADALRAPVGTLFGRPVQLTDQDVVTFNA